MKKILFGSALTLLSFGCSHPQSKTQNTEVYNVAVQKMVVVDQNENGSYIGSVEASVTIPLSFQMSGLVKSVLVSEGEAVKKGQLLAVLDSSSAFNAYQVAEAKERQTQDAFNRLETVYKNGSLTEIKWVEIQTGLD